MLLYTLVYGAMPFDGSNFKRLVKQISSGDYYEPADKPSSRLFHRKCLFSKSAPSNRLVSLFTAASTLIRQMLLVDPVKRATVEDICSHWYIISSDVSSITYYKLIGLLFSIYLKRWVNESYGESCLEVAEELANQTPVRLDLLLTILPPVESAETVVVDPKQVNNINIYFLVVLILYLWSLIHRSWWMKEIRKAIL